MRSGIPYQKNIWNEKALSGLKMLGNEDDLIDSYYFFRNKEMEHLRKIGNISRNTKKSALLGTHPGIGEFGSLMMVAEIADISRFESPKNYFA